MGKRSIFRSHIIMLLSASLLLSACETHPTFLGLDPSAAMDLMSQGSYDFLVEIDVDPQRLDRVEIYGIERGSAYYTARALEDLGRQELAFALLGRQHAHGEEPWSSRSARVMLEQARTDEQRGTAVGAIGSLSSVEDIDDDLASAWIETLWSLGRYEEMLERYEAFGRPAVLSAWAALAQLATGHDRAVDTIREALQSAPRGRGLVILHDYLQDGISGSVRDHVERELRPFEYELLEFRSAVAEADWQSTADFLATVREDPDRAPSGEAAQALGSRVLIGDLREAWFRRRESAAGAEIMEALSIRLTGEVESYALEAAGRLWRAESANRQAVRVLERALEEALPGADRDRVLFHLLHAQISYDHHGVIERADRYLSMIHDPLPFNEIWERVLSHLLVNRRWQDLAEIYGPVRRYASERTLGQYGVALASAIDAGFVSAAWVPDVPAGVSSRSHVLEAAYRQNGSIYYRMLAAVMLGEPLRGMPDDARVVEPPVQSLDDRLVAGYLDFGLVDRAYAAVREEGRHPGEDVLRRLAVILADQGDFLRSLRTANRLTALEGAILDSDLARIIYPEAFAEEMDRVLDEFPLERDIFYGLVREESYFDPQIQSWVGATGLAQLMPQTAADVAARLRVTDFDLTDPYTNLRFGARYLNDLVVRLDAWVPAMIAYNAGQGRVRTWLSERQGLPMILFHESVPFQEPRSYIRNITVSAVYYEFLSGRGDGTGVIRLFFPELGDLRP
ncbi:MAG: hypothetical protein EA383_17665 [Spirochaetaceae bacterium]|nr:MAG: hypothetical protein EA383_17665 [Spirochaetaceae bacterium]